MRLVFAVSSVRKAPPRTEYLVSVGSILGHFVADRVFFFIYTGRSLPDGTTGSLLFRFQRKHVKAWLDNVTTGYE